MMLTLHMAWWSLSKPGLIYYILLCFKCRIDGFPHLFSLLILTGMQSSKESYGRFLISHRNPKMGVSTVWFYHYVQCSRVDCCKACWLKWRANPAYSLMFIKKSNNNSSDLNKIQTYVSSSAWENYRSFPCNLRNIKLWKQSAYKLK